MTIASTTDGDSAALRNLIQRTLYSVHTSMPGIVKSFKQSNGFLVVDVQPAIQQLDTLDGKTGFRNIDVIPNVIVCVPRSQGLGLSVTIPIQPGDEGMLHFAERSLDNWAEKGGVQPPHEPIQPRSHDFSDAVFVPGVINGATNIDAYAMDAIEIRNTDATVALSVTQTMITMRSGAASIYLPGDGTIHFSGNIVHDVGGIAGAGKLKTHGHPQDPDSAGNTEQDTGEAQ